MEKSYLIVSNGKNDTSNKEYSKAVQLNTNVKGYQYLYEKGIKYLDGLYQIGKIIIVTETIK